MTIGLELLYVALGAVYKDEGDFGQIAQKGGLPLLLASAALVAECVLGFFAVMQVY